MRRTRIKENQPISSDEVDTASTSFTTEQEDELLPLWIVERIYEFLPFGNGHGSIQPEVAVSGELAQLAEP